MSLFRRLRIWWDHKVNWEYYATLELIERTVPPEQRFYMTEKGKNHE